MPINIAVFIKQVPDTEAAVAVEGEGKSLQIEKKFTLSFFDALAVEEAIRLKERFGGAVTAVTLGGEESAEALRTCLAMGADQAVLLTDEAFKGSDGPGVARALAAWARRGEYNLFFCGMRATDDEAGVVGPMAAEFLSIPHATNVIKIDVAEDLSSSVVQREVEGGEEEIELPLPALFCAQKGLNEPRVPPIMGVMKAMKAPIEKRGLADLDMDSALAGEKGAQASILRYFPPRKRPQVTILKWEGENVAAKLVEMLREEYKVI